MAQPAPAARWRSYALLLLNTVLWGPALIFVKPAFDVTTAFRFLWYRFTMAAVLSLPILFILLPQVKKLGRKLHLILGLELLAAVTLGLLYTGLDYTSALEASLLATTTPLFTTVLGFLVLKEKIEKHEQLGLGIAFIGTIALTIVPAWAYMNGLRTFSLIGNLLILAQNCVQASYFILAKRYYQTIPKFLITAISFNVGMVTFFFLSLLELDFDTVALMRAVSVDLQSIPVWWSVFYMAVFGSIVAATAYIKGQENIEASEASLFHYLQPLVYLPLGVLLLGETLTITQVSLMILILVGVGLAQVRLTVPTRAKTVIRPRRRTISRSRS